MISVCEGLKLQAHIDTVQALKSIEIRWYSKESNQNCRLITVSIDFAKGRKIIMPPAILEKKEKKIPSRGRIVIKLSLRIFTLNC